MMRQQTRLQRKQRDMAERAQAPQSVYDTLATPGHPLDAATRAFMEPRFGHDFSRVRIHTDPQAAQSAAAVNALAYTVRRDVVFGAGQYQPGTDAGKRLIAHELHQPGIQRKEMPDAGVDAPADADFPLPGGVLNPYSETVSPVIPSPAPLPWIDVRAVPAAVAGLFGYEHLFIVVTDTTGRTWYYRGGPGNKHCANTTWPFEGIKTNAGQYKRGSYDWDPSAPSVRVAHGRASDNKRNCFKKELSRIDTSCVQYNALGPNSNTVVRTLLQNCGLPLRKPAGTDTPGWSHRPI
jgi:hypothetical protein